MQAQQYRIDFKNGFLEFKDLAITLPLLSTVNTALVLSSFCAPAYKIILSVIPLLTPDW